MITDDTILKKLLWRLFDNNESYDVAMQKYNDILSYVFPDLDTTNFRVQKDGIEIKRWCKDTRCFKGINLNFYDNLERRTNFRCIAFKGTALDFKAKVWQKFEVLKALRQATDDKTAIKGKKRIASAIEIQELTKIAKQKFNEYEVNITQSGEGYRLQLETNFDNKSDLLDFCIPGE